MPSRRQFLTSSAAAITAASLPKFLHAQRRGGDLFTPGSLGAYIQGSMTQATFEGVIGSVFTAFLDNNAVAYLRLQKVIAANSELIPSPMQGGGSSPIIRGTPPNPHQGMVSTQMGMSKPQAVAAPAPPGTRGPQQLIGFQLIFNNGGVVFDQGSYLLDHGTLGRFTCFLVPGASSAGPTSCATFCYLSDATAAPPRPLPVPIRPGW